MDQVGIRALKQNASAVVAEAAAGKVVTITDRGRPTAQIIPIQTSPFEVLIATGRVRPAKGKLTELPKPVSGVDLSAVLRSMRDEERY